VTDLAALELVAQPTMTTIVGRLEARGFVQRKRDGADRRVVTVALTPAGREKLAELRSGRTAFLSGHMAGLGADELTQLTAVLPVLDHILESATS
jgi:DNA-binding MarR family transcriptional regulator